jgi:H+-translocating NAD(P) transhydrogenase subunit alpha
LRIGVPRETLPGETRVAAVPARIPGLLKKGHAVCVESGAGLGSHIPDSDFEAAGATILGTSEELYGTADIVFKVRAPVSGAEAGPPEIGLLREGTALIALLAPFAAPETIRALAERRVTGFAMEFVPRTTRAQSMDVLSSMATLAGYKAVLMAAERLPRIFPLLTTAAGTTAPAIVLVLGAGVAGLQAIATAKRLGARVEAFDPRPDCREQVESVGARFVPLATVADAQTADGYAKEQSDEFLDLERETIAALLPRCDVVITTAQIFGKAAPLLITEEMVGLLPSGAVIVDLAAENGGNCELTRPDVVIDAGGVCVLGPTNLPATLPVNASQMYSRNVAALFEHLYRDPDTGLDFDDEITRSACLTHAGEIRNDAVRRALEPSGEAGEAG